LGKLMQAKAARKSDEITDILKGSRGALLSAGFFSGVVNLLMLTGPLFMLQVYDRVLSSGSVPTLVALAVITLGLYAYYGFLEYVRSRIMVRIGRRIEESLRSRVFDTVATLAMRKGGNAGGQPISDLSTIRQYLGGQGPLAFLDMPWVPFYLIVVFLMHWMLGVAAAIAAVVIFVLAVMTELSTRAPTQRAMVAGVKAQLLTEEVRRNSETMHALGMRGKMRAKWSQLQQSSLDDQTRANDAGGTLGAMSRVVRLVVQSGMLALGAYLAIRQEITPGTIIASSIIMSRSLAPVEQAVANWQQFLAFRKARERLGEVLASVPAVDKRMELPPPRGLLDIEQATVMLPNSDKPILQAISFQVKPGQGLGIIGPTGAGKSTLARLLVGLSLPTRGAVRLDGATFDQRSEDETGRYVGYLPQDVQLFDGTVAENIARFDAKPDPNKVIEAAQMASIHDFIMRLPMGYDTPLGENASRLSAGQRQRVALARALYNDPVLLVLDEPNSNLDAEGEAALVNGMKHALQRGAACIVIAHRPSALAVISDLVVLHEGKVAAQGPRDEVLRKVLQKQQAPLVGVTGGQINPGSVPLPQGARS
jgi:PrtD family type I secretion system ABC transporter